MQIWLASWCKLNMLSSVYRQIFSMKEGVKVLHDQSHRIVKDLDYFQSFEE
jgi:hypothetical protein